MYRSHNCGELRISNLEQEVSLSGWVQKVRDKGFFIWIDLRDRYGITQLILDKERSSNEIFDLGNHILIIGMILLVVFVSMNVD